MRVAVSGLVSAIILAATPALSAETIQQKVQRWYAHDKDCRTLPKNSEARLEACEFRKDVGKELERRVGVQT